jgi:hypothetical protein
MTDAPSSGGALRRITQHVAFRALVRSILINMLAPAILYRLASPHFSAGSLIPLAISSLPPILALAYSLIKLRAVDFLGLFAVENVACNVGALLLAHTEMGALIGRALQNVPLALVFFGSLMFGKPLVFYMARQFSTGNDPAAGPAFDAAADNPGAMRTYRIMTWVWAFALLIKSAGSVYLATHFAAKDYLVFSPIWDLVSDSSLVSWTILYGRAKLTGPGDNAPISGQTMPVPLAPADQ